MKTKKRRGGARDESVIHISFTRTQLMFELRRIDCKCQEFRQQAALEQLRVAALMALRAGPEARTR